MLEKKKKKKKKKNDQKVYFFQAGPCAALSSFRVRKWHFSGKRVDFLKSDKKKRCDKGLNTN